MQRHIIMVKIYLHRQNYLKYKIIVCSLESVSYTHLAHLVGKPLVIPDLEIKVSGRGILPSSLRGQIIVFFQSGLGKRIEIPVVLHGIEVKRSVVIPQIDEVSAGLFHGFEILEGDDGLLL